MDGSELGVNDGNEFNVGKDSFTQFEFSRWILS